MVFGLCLILRSRASSASPALGVRTDPVIIVISVPFITPDSWKCALNPPLIRNFAAKRAAIIVGIEAAIRRHVCEVRRWRPQQHNRN